MKTALVVSGGGFQGLGLVRALQRLPDVRVMVCDNNSEHLVRYVCGECVVAPLLADEQAFGAFLLELARRERLEAVFPATARELPHLARLSAALRTLGVAVAVGPERLLDVLLDKLHTHEFLSREGLPVPALLDPLAHDGQAPLFGRPRQGWGGRGIIVLSSLAEALARDDLAASVWTAKLPSFEEFSGDFAISEAGALSPVVLRRRVRTSGGFAVISESVRDAALEALVTRTATALRKARGCGLYNVQLIAPPTGEVFISDVNPRMGTSATHGLAEGVNLPGFFLSGDASPPLPAKRKLARTIRVLEDLVIPRLEAAPRGVVFDLDDTLVDHKQWMFRKLELVYPELSGLISPAVFRLAAAQLIDEGERAHLIDRLLELLGLPASLRDRLIEAYRAAVVSPTPLYADVESTLEALHAAGLSLAILSDNPPATQRTKLAHARPLDRVDAVVFAREHGGEKPARGAFVETARALSIDPSRLVMVGDNYFRDGVGALEANYLHALILRRGGGFLNPNEALMAVVPAELRQRLDLVDGLLAVRHACLWPGQR